MTQIDQIKKFLDDLEQENKRVREACRKTEKEICDTLGRALGYQLYADYQKNFPGAKKEDGYFVGEHSSKTIACEAAMKIEALKCNVYDQLYQLRSEVEVSPVRCRCGGVGVVIKDEDGTAIVTCSRAWSHSGAWNATKADALAKWAAENTPKPEAPKEPELMPCPCGEKAARPKVLSNGNWFVDCIDQACRWHIECSGSKEDLINHWNSRAEAKP
jgi:hypothetical protein